MQATGTISYEPTQYEHVEATVRYVIERNATYERALEFWNSFRADSPIYVQLPDTIDWSRIEDGELYPKGVPMGKTACHEKFVVMKNNLDTKWIKDFQFEQKHTEAMVNLLKIGKNAFPGLIQKDAEIDIFMKNALQSALLESIIQYIKGRGKLSALDDLYREISLFSSIRNKSSQPKSISMK